MRKTRRKCWPLALAAPLSISLATCDSTVKPEDLPDWAELPPLPLPVRAAAAATDGERVYVVGGTSAAGRTTTLQILEFESRSWSFGAPIPAPTDWGAAAWANGELHFIGGVTNGASATTQHLVYARQTNQWRQAPPLPMQVAGTTALSRGSRIFVFAGNSGGSPAYTDNTFIYDAGTEVWSNGSSVPEPRINWSGAVWGDRLFLIGGQVSGLETSGDFLSYDPDANSWTSLTPLPLPREAHGVASAAGLICAIGGRLAASGNFNVPFADVSCYDAGNDTWSPAPGLPRGRQELVAVTVGGTIVALGGADDDSVPVGDVTMLRVQ